MFRTSLQSKSAKIVTIIKGLSSFKCYVLGKSVSTTAILSISQETVTSNVNNLAGTSSGCKCSQNIKQGTENVRLILRSIINFLLPLRQRSNGHTFLVLILCTTVIFSSFFIDNLNAKFTLYSATPVNNTANRFTTLFSVNSLVQ